MGIDSGMTRPSRWPASFPALRVMMRDAAPAFLPSRLPSFLPVLVLMLVLMMLGGCATQSRQLLQQSANNLPRRAELASTPFFPQERYQCGPAALATALTASGLAATPEALVPQVYVPAREGSLQPEMLAAARRNGSPGMIIPPRLDALLEEVSAGTPVVVLQNLSLPIAPLWHYAVVIGYDLDREEVLLRSGTTERETMSLSTFEHTWKRSGYWAMVAPAPGRMPRTVHEDVAVDALVAYEKAVRPPQAHAAYRAALARWPRNLTLLVGAGNSAYAMGDREAAASAFREAAREYPDNVPALNNLATVLAELGQHEQARAVAQQAVALGGPWKEQSLATLREVTAKVGPDSIKGGGGFLPGKGRELGKGGSGR
jgi:predicted double-glycine peptidase